MHLITRYRFLFHHCGLFVIEMRTTSNWSYQGRFLVSDYLIFVGFYFKLPIVIVLKKEQILLCPKYY